MSRRPCLFKQTDVRRAVRAAESAGKVVSSVKVTREGFELVLAVAPAEPEADADVADLIAEAEARHGKADHTH